MGGMLVCAPCAGSVSSTDSDRYSGDSSCEDASSGHREQASPADGRLPHLACLRPVPLTVTAHDWPACQLTGQPNSLHYAVCWSLLQQVKVHG